LLLAGSKAIRFTWSGATPIFEPRVGENAMQARDIMTSAVISVGPQTSVLQVAAILREQRIGGVPVLARNELVGIVTERDLLHRHELGTEHRSVAPAWWRRVVAPGLEPDRYVKSHGRCAEHVMTPNVVVAEPQTSLRDVLGLFERHRIGRVPVLRDGRLVGIVTSADLVKALARGIWVPAGEEGDSASTDAEIHERLLSELRRQEWWNSGSCGVEVRLGIVRFTGFVENEPQRKATLVAAENTPGVRAVEDERTSLAELPVMF
jgi:CBS domain-containing protein